MDLTPLVEWVLRQVRERASSPMPVSYVTLCPREGSAYPQRGRVDVEGCADLGATLREEVADILRSGEADDRAVSRVKVRIYGVKGSTELASSTFRVGTGNDDEPSHATGREGELVAVVREQRLMMASQHELIKGMTGGVFSLGLEALKGQGEMQKQIGELTGALVIAEQGKQTVFDQLKPMMDMVAPAVPILLAKLTGPTS